VVDRAAALVLGSAHVIGTQLAKCAELRDARVLADRDQRDPLGRRA